jgi:hypothetical protein
VRAALRFGREQEGEGGTRRRTLTARHAELVAGKLTLCDDTSRGRCRNGGRFAAAQDTASEHEPNDDDHHAEDCCSEPDSTLPHGTLLFGVTHRAGRDDRRP